MLEILSFIFGGIFRLLPEVLKWVDKREERKHELDLLERNMQYDRMRAELELSKIAAEADVILGKAEMDAMIAATKAQGQKSGVRWVDAINSLMRPLITFWWVIVLYTAALCVQFYALVWVHQMGMPAAVLTVFGAQEKAIALSIIGFWFVDRAIRKPGLVR